MDFGKIQNTINTLIVENYQNKEYVTPLVKKYIKLLKENNILKSLFITYNNICHCNLRDTHLIREIIETSINSIKDNYSVKEINNSVNLLKEELNIELVDDNENLFYDYIKTLLIKEYNVKNIKDINESKEKLICLIKDKSNKNEITLTNNRQEIELVNEVKSLDDLDIIADITLKKLTEKYELSDIDKLILESKIVEKEEDKLVLFDLLKEQAKSKLDIIITDNIVANDVKVLALNAKIKLYEMVFDVEKYDKDVEKLINIVSDKND